MPAITYSAAVYRVTARASTVTVRASGRVARWFFNSWIFHVIRLVYIISSGVIAGLSPCRKIQIVVPPELGSPITKSGLLWFTILSATQKYYSGEKSGRTIS